MKHKSVGFPRPEQTEAVFYEAFMHADIDVMAAIWSVEQALCVHPGSDLISGYKAVIRSWQHIHDQEARSEISFKLLNKIETETMSVHLTKEIIKTVDHELMVVISTNIFQKMEKGWQMVQHHGSLVQQHDATGQTLQ